MMSDDAGQGTIFEIKVDILADLWTSYRSQPDFKDFVEYNDLGLPLAFLVNEELVQPSELAKQMVEESWFLLLESLGIDEDTGFDSLDDLMLG